MAGIFLRWHGILEKKNVLNEPGRNVEISSQKPQAWLKPHTTCVYLPLLNHMEFMQYGPKLFRLDDNDYRPWALKYYNTVVGLD